MAIAPGNTRGNLCRSTCDALLSWHCYI